MTLLAASQYRRTGRNDFGYQYGDVVLANVAYEHKIGATWDVVVEANYRHADRDEVDRDGTLDPDTGSQINQIRSRLARRVYLWSRRAYPCTSNASTIAPGES